VHNKVPTRFDCGPHQILLAMAAACHKQHLDDGCMSMNDGFRLVCNK